MIPDFVPFSRHFHLLGFAVTVNCPFGRASLGWTSVTKKRKRGAVKRAWQFLLVITAAMLGYMVAGLNLVPALDSPDLTINQWTADNVCYTNKDVPGCTCGCTPVSVGTGEGQKTRYHVQYSLPDDGKSYLGLFLTLKEPFRLGKSEMLKFSMNPSNPAASFKVIFCYSARCVAGHAPQFTEEYEFVPQTVAAGKSEIEMSIELRKYFCRLYKEPLHGIIFTPLTPSPRGQQELFEVGNIEFVRRVPVCRAPIQLEEGLFSIIRLIIELLKLGGR